MGWTSTLADNAMLPRTWGRRCDADAVVQLKDTQKRNGFWRNYLAAPDCFVYCIPPAPVHAWEREVVDALRAKTHEVHLFSTPNGRDEWYGVWCVSSLREQVRPGVTEVVLARKEPQDPLIARRYEWRADATRFRSRNERAHARLLEDLFPSPDWTVSHEPETLLDVHAPSVVDGKATGGLQTSRSYTCDFVVSHTRNCMRVCIESKPCEEKIDAEALFKARTLRDRTRSRVVIMCGSEWEVRWWDLGAPGADQEVWHETSSQLLAALADGSPPSSSCSPKPRCELRGE